MLNLSSNVHKEAESIEGWAAEVNDDLAAFLFMILLI
jgi:hypothetical protein